MTAAELRTRFEREQVAVLATVGTAGAPHLVPITFALLDKDTVVTAVDHKPKRTLALRRLENIAANPAVSLLAHHYEDDWAVLWWVRADGVARIGQGGESERALAALAARYPDYRSIRPTGPVIVVSVERWSGWSASKA